MDKTQFNPQDPNALFSPDQWTNQFSNYNNKALPWPSTFYTGTPAGSMPPTDAMGNPIQSFLDMQAKHDAWRPPPSSPASSAPMGVDPNFGLENQWLAANGQPIQLASSQKQGVLGPQTQAALQAMNAASSAAGAPDAQGQNQAVPGTTLNSTPDAASGSAAPAQQSPYPSLATMNSLQRNNALAGYSPTTGQPEASGTDALFNRQFAAFGSGAPQQAARAPAAAAGPTNPFDMHQAYLDALSMPQGNRGLTTPGATVPAGPSAQPGPGALQAFLQNWRPAQSGPGSGFQQGFAGGLKGLGY